MIMASSGCRILPCLVVVILLSCMIAQTVSLAVMSVDLGSEFMKIAIVKPGVPMETALNKESKRKTPVLLTLRNGERFIGDPATSTAIRFPNAAFSYFLDLLGKTTDNPQVKLWKKRFPWHNVTADPDLKTVQINHDNGQTYTPEELMAMILGHAQSIASNYAEQPITDAVITVPVFFNQAERRSMMRAAEIAGLKVLQLINDNTAVALNYGVFRRKSFNTTAVNYMFYDMGASSTTATIVSYQLVKAKNPATGIAETNPVLSIKGIGFDRNLGGLEFQIRLRDHLAKLFNEQKKTPNDVTKSPRAMAKLMKEAGRLKHVLSANSEHVSQVEGVLDDEDFKATVTRATFEAMCEDLFEQVPEPVEDAMRVSEMTWDEISEVILMGGSTRIPRVKSLLQKTIGRQELGMSINTDEAAALGGVYQAAHLSKGFKVKQFGLKDATLYPIQVEFDRVRTGEDKEFDYIKSVKRNIFAFLNPYPQKKVMTFNKHKKDFNFDVNYGDLSHLTAEQNKSFGITKLTKVSLYGVEKAHTSNDEAEAKGVKAHFRMDESGLLTLEKVEAHFETQSEAPVATGEEESTLSKIGNYFFGGDKDDAKEGGVEEPKPEDKAAESETKDGEKKDSGEEKKDEEKKDSGEEKKDSGEEKKDEGEEKKDNEKKEDGEKKESEEKEKGSEEEEEKKFTPDDETPYEKKFGEDPQEELKTPETEKKEEPEEKKKEEAPVMKAVAIKEPIRIESVVVDLPDPDEGKVKSSKKLIEKLRRRDEAKAEREKAQNDLEAFIIDAQDKLYQEEYELHSTGDQREAIMRELSAANDWLYEASDDTNVEEFDEKLTGIKDAFKALDSRVKETRERPRALEALNSVMNYSEHFMAGMKNYTGEDLPFTEVEVSTLEGLIADTKKWNTSTLEELAIMTLTDPPTILVEDIAKKINELDREVKYLLNKLKIWKPKKPKKTPANETKINETKIETEDAPAGEKPSSEEKPASEETPEDIKIDSSEAPGTEEGEKPRKTRKEKKAEKEAAEAAEEETLQLDGAPPLDEPAKEEAEQDQNDSKEEEVPETEPSQKDTDAKEEKKDEL